MCFEFEFFAVRAHSGHGTINWNGHNWTGVGDVLRRNFVSKSASLSSMHSSRAESAASLSLGSETQEVIARQYYRDRKMEWSLCALPAAAGDVRPIQIWHFDFADILDQIHTLDGMEKGCFDAALDVVYSPLAEEGDEMMKVGWMAKISREGPAPSSLELKY